jgi:hypothetical protein
MLGLSRTYETIRLADNFGAAIILSSLQFIQKEGVKPQQNFELSATWSRNLF